MGAVLALLANRAYGVMEEYVLVAVPLFIFMAQLLDASGIAERLFETMHIVMGRIRGGLGIAVIIACTIFAATAGVVGATEVSIGLLAIPALMRVKYNIPLIAGCICAGGTLGILIPPSIMLVVYGSLTQLSVGWLYAAAFGPGFLLSTPLHPLHRHHLLHQARVRPGRDRVAVTQRRKSSRCSASPSSRRSSWSSSCSAASCSPSPPRPRRPAWAASGPSRSPSATSRFTWKMIKDACWSTTLTTSMIMALFLGGNAFQAIFMGLGGGDAIANFILGTQLSPMAVLFLMMGIVFFLGCFLDWLGILLIVTPIFIPVSMELGFNQLWFGTLICVNLQMAFLTPPFGYSLFYLKGIAPPEMNIYHIYKGVVPFVILQWVGLILCIFVPDIVMWAPVKFFGPGVLG